MTKKYRFAKATRRFVTIIVHRDGDLDSRSIRVPLWLARIGVVTGTGLLALIVLGAVLYAPIVRRAARVSGLNREIERLAAENQQVQELATTLDQVEARYAQLRTMLGAEIVPLPPRPEAALPTSSALIARPPGAEACYEYGPSKPGHWPLDEPGLITRGPVGAGSSEEVHTGLDIAVSTGTPIRAAGGGVVTGAGTESEYGLFVHVEHPDGYESMYGHASRLLVATGDTVQAGQVVGLSGSTGRSTAPHLHFEILLNGQSVDPRPALSHECRRKQVIVRGE